MKRSIESSFPTALRLVRKSRGLTQEDFDQVSSRVYISALERGIKQPTLPKVEAIAKALGVHPLTLLALSYCRKPTSDEFGRLVEVVAREVAELTSS